MADVQYPEDPQVEAEPNAQPGPAPDVAASVPIVRIELRTDNVYSVCTAKL